MGTRRQEEAPFGGRLKSCMHGARADLLSMSYVVPKIAIYFFSKKKKDCHDVIRSFAWASNWLKLKLENEKKRAKINNTLVVIKCHISI